MSVYKPTYPDPKTGKLVRSRVWWYRFQWQGRLIRNSSKVTNKRDAEQIEAAERTRLAKGEVGIKEKAKCPTLAEFAPRFTTAIETICAEKPATVGFYKEKLRRLLADKKLPGLRLDRIDEPVIDDYKQRRTRQKSRYKRAVGLVR